MGLMLSYKKYQPKYFNCDTGKTIKPKNIDKYPRWYKEEYDQWGNKTYHEHSNGSWYRCEYNKNKQNNQIIFYCISPLT